MNDVQYERHDEQVRVPTVIDEFLREYQVDDGRDGAHGHGLADYGGVARQDRYVPAKYVENRPDFAVLFGLPRQVGVHGAPENPEQDEHDGETARFEPVVFDARHGQREETAPRVPPPFGRTQRHLAAKTISI